MRVKVLGCVVRHNKVEYGDKDVFELGDKDAKRLVGLGCVRETSEAVTEKETETKAANVAEVLIEDLTPELVNKLKQKELLSVAKRMDLVTDDNKAATLKAAILKAIDKEEVINLDEMDEDDLRALADEEGVDILDQMDVTGIREILAEALAE